MWNPDRWVVVKITTEKHGTVYKLLAGWYGGFAGSDSWRMNSGIASIKQLNDSQYEVIGYSGSSYVVHVNNNGLSSLMQGVIDSFVRDIKEVNGTIEILDIESTIKELGEADDHS